MPPIFKEQFKKYFEKITRKEPDNNKQELLEDIIEKAREFAEQEVVSRNREVEKLKNLMEQSEGKLPENWMIYLPQEEVYETNEETEGYLNKLVEALRQRDDTFVIDIKPPVAVDEEAVEDFPMMLSEVVRQEAQRLGLDAEVEPIIQKFQKDNNYIDLATTLGEIIHSQSLVEGQNRKLVATTHGMENTPRDYLVPFASHQKWSAFRAFKGVDIIIRTIDIDKAYEKDERLPTAYARSYRYHFLSPQDEIRRDVFSISKEKIRQSIGRMEKFDTETFLKNFREVRNLLQTHEFVNLYSTERKTGKSMILQALKETSSDDWPVDILYITKLDDILDEIKTKLDGMSANSLLILDEATELISDSKLQGDLKKILKSAHKKNIRVLFSGLKEATLKDIASHEILSYRSEKYSAESEN